MDLRRRLQLTTICTKRDKTRQEDWVSLDLIYINGSLAQSEPQTTYFSFTVLNQLISERNIVKQANHIFSAASRKAGFAQFVSLRGMTSPGLGYIVGDIARIKLWMGMPQPGTVAIPVRERAPIIDDTSSGTIPVAVSISEVALPYRGGFDEADGYWAVPLFILYNINLFRKVSKLMYSD